jgi:hypothetical protein
LGTIGVTLPLGEEKGDMKREGGTEGRSRLSRRSSMMSKQTFFVSFCYFICFVFSNFVRPPTVLKRYAALKKNLFSEEKQSFEKKSTKNIEIANCSPHFPGLHRGVFVLFFPILFDLPTVLKRYAALKKTLFSEEKKKVLKKNQQKISLFPGLHRGVVILFSRTGKGDLQLYF